MSAERDKDILTDDKSTEFMPKVIDYLSDKGFDLIGHSRNQEKVAESAIDEGDMTLLSLLQNFCLCLFVFVFDTILPPICNSHVAEKAAGCQHQFVR